MEPSSIARRRAQAAQVTLLSPRRSLAPADYPPLRIRTLGQLFDLPQRRPKQRSCVLPSAPGSLEVFRVSGSACLHNPLIGGYRVSMRSAPLFHCTDLRHWLGIQGKPPDRIGHAD